MGSKIEKWRRWAVAASVVLLALAFLASGISKLAGASTQVEMFKAFGLPLWTMVFTGAFEVGSVVLLLIPQTRFFGAMCLCLVMLGAATVHLASGVMPAMVFVNGVLLALSAWVASQSGKTVRSFEDARLTPGGRHGPLAT